MMLKLIFATFG